MKKAFTLIELLAVIIILAVIALIATPLVLDVVEDARSQARKNSIYGYAEAVKLGVYEHQFKNQAANPQINSTWLSTNVVIKGDIVVCTKVKYHEVKGVLLNRCTVGNDNTEYYYDGNSVLTERPEEFDDIFIEPPVVTSKSVAITIGLGKNINLLDSFTIMQEGNLKIIKQECVNKLNNEPITQTSALTEGTYDIACTVTNEKNLSDSEEIKVRVVDSTYKCVSAQEGTLHQEICRQTSSFCYAAGYRSGTEKGTTIEYGKIKELGTDLESGDALDCDVDGNGTYDPITERFYYVSSLYDTINKAFNDDYAVLIYYTNTVNGTASTTGTAYDSRKENWHGPVTAATHLPTINQWTNISLKSYTRQILNEKDANTIDGGTLGTFNYINSEGIEYAARLLTYKELSKECGEGNPNSTGYLDTKCEYLMENTQYSNDNISTVGTWLETPVSNSSIYVWGVYSTQRRLTVSNKASIISRTARPVIEVLKTDILH